MRVFVDTSAFYALASETDRWHASARALHEQLKRDGDGFVTTNYVILEAVSLLQRRHGVSEAERFGDGVADRADVVWIEAAQHRAAWKLWRERHNRGLSLVDCSSFVVMRDREIRRAFAFDEQFREAGFTLLQPPPDRVAERRAVYRAGRQRR